MDKSFKSLKLRRLNDDRVRPNIIAVQVANAGGIETSTDNTQIIYHQYLTERSGWIKVLRDDDVFLLINRNLSLVTNYDELDKEKEREVLIKHREYYEK